MKLKEIYDKKWVIPDDLKIDYFNYGNIPKEEQECHFNIMKVGYNSDGSEVKFSCSFQEYMTKLSKSNLVTVTKVLVYKSNQYVLQIDGFIDIYGISIRKRRTTLSEAEKKRRTLTLRATLDRNASHS